MPTAVPEPGYPMLTRMIASPPFPEPSQGAPPGTRSAEEPVEWVVGRPHPLVPDMKVMRMFVDRGDVEVYPLSSDGKAGMRNLIAMSWVRLIEEPIHLRSPGHHVMAMNGGQRERSSSRRSGRRSGMATDRELGAFHADAIHEYLMRRSVALMLFTRGKDRRSAITDSS